MGAEAGTISFMVGASSSLYPKVLEICKMMGKESSIFHCGELGAGLKTKILNNYLSSITALATAETINIGIRGGLDAKKLNEVLNASSGQNFNLTVNNPVPGLTPKNAASNGYRGGFSLELCLGVLELGVKTAEDVGAKTVLGKPMFEAYTDAGKDPRFKGKDSKVIYQWLALPKGEPIQGQ
jgi:3-hydroxyisobutyrate dehydrogenase-like beta-hydroxyacid dehydrogenase